MLVNQQQQEEMLAKAMQKAQRQHDDTVVDAGGGTVYDTPSLNCSSSSHPDYNETQCASLSTTTNGTEACPDSYVNTSTYVDQVLTYVLGCPSTSASTNSSICENCSLPISSP